MAGRAMSPTLIRLRCLALLVFSGLAFGYERPEPNWHSIGLSIEKTEPSYWLSRAEKPETVMLTPQAIAERNARLLATEPSMTALANWPDSMTTAAIRAKIEGLSKPPQNEWFKSAEQAISQAEIDAWMDNLDLENIVPSDNGFFGLVVSRAALRRFPSAQRAFDRQGGLDIDRLQESALFPGTPVAVLHESKDKQWLFVQSENYAAWVDASKIALAIRKKVLAYANKQPRRYISGSQVRTVFHPYAEEVSEQLLDMGTSFPLRTDWSLSRTLNDQGTLGTWVIEMPLRRDNGLLDIKPVLIARSADTAPAPLPASRGNVIRQSFKFLGERYGWGHDYNGRDCSGFVSEVYRSLGILLPRNTGDQQRSMNFKREAFAPELSRAQRIARLQQLQIGDLVFIPGHVMLVIGFDEHGPWVIHDANKSGVIIDGRFQSLASNSVIVTPLLPLALSGDRLYADAVTAIQRILPGSP
jgi:hypothetical protein